MKILIDPGHRNNINDFGATGNGQKESVLALAVAKKLQDALKDYNVDTYLSRASEDETISIDARYRKAREVGADLLMSIHINSAANSSASGIEVLYKEQQLLATHLTNALCAATGAKNRGAKHRTDLGVLNGFSNSVLLELGFISNTEECEKLVSTEYQNKLVDAIVKVLADTYKFVAVKEDTALKEAVNKIIDSGININATSWNKIENINLKNVPALINKLGGIDKLAEKKIISSPDVWIKGTYTKENVRSLLIKYIIYSK